MLKIKNLYKSFGNTNVLENISLEVNSGEICVLLGKSGNGKSTLLRCICGLESFDSGEIIINNKSLSNIKEPLNTNVGMVFQNFNLFPHLSVLENITIPMINVLNQDKKTAFNNALSLLETLNLKNRANAYPCELSGGQKQRVAIARALALNPNILCLDEPTSALDYDNIEIIKKIIFDLKRAGKTILIVTHDNSFAEIIADKIVTI